jgi:hypothetical protein
MRAQDRGRPRPVRFIAPSVTVRQIPFALGGGEASFRSETSGASVLSASKARGLFAMFQTTIRMPLA